MLPGVGGVREAACVRELLGGVASGGLLLLLLSVRFGLPSSAAEVASSCARQLSSAWAKTSCNRSAASLIWRPMRIAARFHTARTRRSASRTSSPTDAYSSGSEASPQSPSTRAA